ncbi:hypothetical protein Daesc_007880 [Daldinia eschscholtzii]|uniref:Oligopeptide transporter n=1 Tax=Daldinia eschscholtzii TaxID=292717 RepID=A0AAX6MFW4_9PEZI
MSPPPKSPESQVRPYTSPCSEVDNDQIAAVTSRPIPISNPQNLCPRDATPEDLEKLRHVADKIPRIAWLVAFTGAAQRFAFYGTTVPWPKFPPQSDVLPHAGKILALAARSRFHLSAADPSYQSFHYNRTVPWTAAFVHEIRRGLRSCRAVICFTVFYLCFNQSTTNIISQANQMEISGVSNDTVQSLNAIFYIIINPIIQNWLFPFLARRHIAFGPIARMTVSFFLLAVAMGYAAGTQALIYSRGPCFSYPRACEAATVVGVDGVTTEHRPNEVSMWVQAPFHLFLAVGEIFGFVALNEFEYIEAPTNMKALVKAFEQFTAALGAGLSMALGPVSKDPWLVTMNASLAGTMAISGVAFYAVFWRFDRYWHTNQNITNSDDSRVIVTEDSKE